MKVVTVSQMQQAERDCSQYGISLDQLMQNAGTAFAEETRKILGDLQKQNILVLVGPGNNGGDGLVAARYLFDWGAARVNVYLCGQRPENDFNLNEVKKRAIHLHSIQDDLNFNKLKEWLAESTSVLDAVFGTGKIRPLSGPYSQIFQSLNEIKSNRSDLALIALDLPSGLNADTGAVDPLTPAVDHTITLGFPKVGLFNLPGARLAGKITVVDIGIPSKLVDYVNFELMEAKSIRPLLPARPPVSNKGTFGNVLAWVGSLNYIGAAYLSCCGTIRVGAGLTTLATGSTLQPILATKLNEITYLPLPEAQPGFIASQSLDLICQRLPEYNTLLLGCGLGQHPSHIELLNKLLLDSRIKLPATILDADGLNILSKTSDWWHKFTIDAVMTPHAGEMARLTGKSIEEIQTNRIQIALEAAAAWNKTIVLKGAYTVIASPDGRVRISPFANAGLASAGTGDVLAGAIAGMAAQGLSLLDAASCGVYVHGLAGEMVKEEMGDSGMIASDLLPVLPKAIRQLKSI